MPYGTVNADLMSTSSGQSLGAGNATGFKNRIINGAMTFDQRNNGASVTAGTSQIYTLDRWFSINSVTSKYTIQQNAGGVTPPAGFVNYLGCTSTAATSVGSSDYYHMVQRIEGLNVSDLGWGTANAKPVVLSFQVYSSLTGTFGGALRNSAQNRSYPFSYTISSANTWTTISISITGDTTGTWLTTNGVGIDLTFSLGTGSTFSGTAGSWAATNYASSTGATNVVSTNGATFYITGVQLEVGSSASSFEVRDIGRELMLCQRYYEKSYPLANAPGTSTVSGSSWFYISVTSGLGSGYLAGYVAFKVIKRATPTITFYSYSGTAGYVSDGNVTNYATVGINGQSSEVQFGVGNNSGSTWAPGGSNVTCHWTANAEL